MASSNDSAALPRRPGALGAHSVNCFVFTVPDIAEAERFYQSFGLDARRDGNRLDLYAFGHPHRWASIFGNGQPKKMQYLSLGIFADDLDAFTRKAEQEGRIDPHPLSDGEGVWLRDADGTPVQLTVAPKVSPSAKTEPAAFEKPAPGKGAAPSRKVAAPVRPRYLSHVLLFSPDVRRQIEFYTRVVGLRLSDTASDIVAFMHGPHSSDHHLVALAKSNAPGFHHSSWDVGSLHDVGLGAERMKELGYTEGWGLGRHVLGSNYFYYVRDPWGSFAEYSYDIDFVPVDLDWPATDHPPEDSFYVWGPPVPDNFVQNFEGAASAALVSNA